MQQQKYSPAIYTHCYDTSGTRLFAAGGPLQIGLKGNYIALFQWKTKSLFFFVFPNYFVYFFWCSKSSFCLPFWYKLAFSVCYTIFSYINEWNKSIQKMFKFFRIQIPLFYFYLGRLRESNFVVIFVGWVIVHYPTCLTQNLKIKLSGLVECLFW